MGSIDSTKIVTIGVETAKNLLNSGYTYLDVRTVEEFEKGHVATEKIVNVPYQFNSPNGSVKNDRFLEEVSAIFKKNDRIVVSCQGGGRSRVAAGVLQNDGFTHVRNMDGGYLAWVNGGFSWTKPK